MLPAEAGLLATDAVGNGDDVGVVPVLLPLPLLLVLPVLFPCGLAGLLREFAVVAMVVVVVVVVVVTTAGGVSGPLGGRLLLPALGCLLTSI